MPETLVPIQCAHPRTSVLLDGEVTPDGTAAELVTDLVAEGFVEQAPPGRPYEVILARTDTVIPPNVTFGRAGVQAGDVLNLVQPGQGATGPGRP